jgi:hypothetical protein
MTDSQATAGDGRVFEVEKILKFQGVVVATSGALATISALRNYKVRVSEDTHHKIQVSADIRTFVEEHGMNHEFHLVCYDRDKDLLWTVDNSGTEISHSHWAAEGSGAAFAAGLLEDAGACKTLKEAMSLARRAVTVACKLHVECGGEIRWVRSEAL